MDAPVHHATAPAAAPGQPAPRPRPDPSAALQQRYQHIWQTQMQGVPLLNPALRVQAVGFRPWGARGEHWLGALVTPWFMNLLLVPRIATAWAPMPERASRHLAFPAGVFEFIATHDPALGTWLACSLFSPMHEFATHTAAVQTALAALHGLLQPPAGSAPRQAPTPERAHVAGR